MRYCVSFITDAFFAFFGFVTGRGLGAYPAWYAPLGGALLIGGLLLLAALACLFAGKIRMPLPPEERDGAAGDDTDGCDDAGDKPAGESGQDRKSKDGEEPGKSAPRGGDASPADQPGQGGETRGA